MLTTESDTLSELKKARPKSGYAVSIVINLALLVVVLNIYDWGWFPFLTSQFADVALFIGAGLAAAIAVNLVYLFNENPIVKSGGEILVNLIGVFVTYRVFLIFPFDFSSYRFNWEVVARVLLILAMIGAGVAVLAEATKLAYRVSRRET